MTCDIVVCVKQVPHPDYLGKISYESGKGTMDREGVPTVINPGDRNALEEALRIRDRFSGRVTVLTMGPPQAKRALEDALAMGANTAVHLCDPAFAEADTLATARTLAYGIRKLEHFDLVLCGNTTIDSGTGQVAVQLAETLGLPCITDVEELSFEAERSPLVKRIWERGYIKVRIRLPAVIAVAEGSNQPRLPSVLDIMAATRKEIREWNASDVCADTSCVGLCGSTTRIYRVGEFHAERRGEILEGPVEKVTALAIDRLVKLDML